MKFAFCARVSHSDENAPRAMSTSNYLIFIGARWPIEIWVFTEGVGGRAEGIISIANVFRDWYRVWISWSHFPATDVYGVYVYARIRAHAAMNKFIMLREWCVAHGAALYRGHTAWSSGRISFEDNIRCAYGKSHVYPWGLSLVISFLHSVGGPSWGLRNSSRRSIEYAVRRVGARLRLHCPYPVPVTSKFRESSNLPDFQICIRACIHSYTSN